MRLLASLSFCLLALRFAERFSYCVCLILKRMLKSRIPTQSNFDWQQINQLAGEDADFAVELLSIFLRDAEGSLAKLASAVSVRSGRDIEEAAHALRGASANVGAIAMSQAAFQLEEAARKANLKRADELLQAVWACDRRLRAELAARFRL